jgi:hypothetical protein
MIDSKKYKKHVMNSFSFLETEFKMNFGGETIHGNAYFDIRYKDKEKVISISLEPIENYFQVILYKLDNGKLPNYDDKTKTIHLDKLNKGILTKLDKKEFDENNKFFKDIELKSETEKLILKSAKDLRLCIKHYNSLII